MYYHEQVRDLFTVNEGIKGEPYCLAHCISADFGMFGGVVVGFNKNYNMKNRLVKTYGSGVKTFEKIGPFILPEPSSLEGDCFPIFNLITKRKVQDKPTYQDLRKTLDMVKKYMLSMGCTKLAIPKIGCGIDGLDWRIVSDMIQEVFEDTKIEVLVCIYGG